MRCIVPVLLCLTGCSAFPLDFGGDSKKSFEWRWSWTRAKPAAQPGDEKPPFDAPPEVEATYAMPDIHAGLLYSLSGGDSRLTPSLGLEIAEFKLPVVRWFVIEIVAGKDLVGFYVGKRLTSIFEISIGGGICWDLETDDWVPVIGADILKF